MKTWTIIRAALILAGVFFLMGMGGFGGDEGPTRVPLPDKNYAVTVIDQDDVHTNLTNFTIGGYTYFFGRRGKGQLAVPFDTIERADFRLQPEGGLEVVLRLKSGEEVALASGRRQEAFGVSKMGNFKIVLGDVKMIQFGGPVINK